MPALGYYQREGNRVHIRNLVRNFQDPRKAAEDAFRCAQRENRDLVTSVEVVTGVRVASDPSGASVREGDVELGVTPCQVLLPAGRHQLDLVQPDCVPSQRTVTLKLGDNPEWTASLAHAPSVLTLESAGEPLELQLDDQPVGSTPVTLNVDAGRHVVKATAPGVFPIVTELRALANERMVARLSPTPARVRVGWLGLSARGYEDDYDLNIPFITDWPSCAASNTILNLCWATPTVYSLPIPLRTTVDLGSDQLNDRVLGRLTPGDHWDCALKMELRSSEYWVIGDLTVVGPEGQPLQKFHVRRDMPSLTFDSEGAARKRADQVVDELLAQSLAWISQNVEPAGLTPEEQSASLDLQGSGPGASNGRE